MRGVKLVRFEDGNGREWWQVAIRGPWYWPFWKYAKRMSFGIHKGFPAMIPVPAEFTTLEEAKEAAREAADWQRKQTIRKVEEVAK